MSGIISPATLFSGAFDGFDNNGVIAPYGKLYFMECCTGLPMVTYTDSLLTAENTHPVILSASGKAEVFLLDAVYDVTLKDSNDVVIWTINNYIPTGGSGDSLPSGYTEQYSEEITGITGDTITLSIVPISDIQVHKNGLLLSSSEYSLLGDVITFTAPLIPGDIAVVEYIGLSSTSPTKVIYSIDVVADLALLDASNITTTNIKGYHIANDGGGDIFNYDPSRIAENDGGTVFDGWVRQFSGMPTSSMFGVTNDGETEYGSEIQAMFDLGVPCIIDNENVVTNIQLTLNSSLYGIDGKKVSLKMTRGIIVASSDIIIQDIRLSGGNNPLLEETALLQLSDNISGVTITNSQFGDVVNTSGDYTDDNDNMHGSYCIWISQEGCQEIVIDKCTFKNMHKTTVLDSVATDGFTGGVVIHSQDVLTSNNTSEVVISNSKFIDFSTPGATKNDSSDADAIRQYCNTTNDNERYGSLDINDCEFRSITKSGIKIASFSNVSISDCNFHAVQNPSNGINSQTPVRLQYAQNSSVTNIRLYGSFQYGIALQGADTTLNGLYHTHSVMDTGGGQPHYSTGDGEITNVLLYLPIAIAGGCVNISNISAMNCGDILSAYGVDLEDKPALQSLNISNVYATLKDNPLSGAIATMGSLHIKDIVLNQIVLKMPMNADGSLDNNQLTKTLMDFNRADSITITNCSLPYYDKVINTSGVGELWSSNTVETQITNNHFYCISDDFLIARVFDICGVQFTRQTNILFTDNKIDLPMSSTDKKVMIQPSDKIDSVVFSGIQIKYLSTQAYYPMLFDIQANAKNIRIMDVSVNADTDLGDLGQAGTNPVVRSTGGAVTDSTVTNIASKYQDCLYATDLLTGSTIANLSSVYSQFIQHNSTYSQTNSTDFGSFVKDEQVQPFYQYATGAPTKTPRKIGDVYFDTAATLFYDAVGLTSGDWVQRT